jgi:toxin ParE1/3/4
MRSIKTWVERSSRSGRDHLGKSGRSVHASLKSLRRKSRTDGNKKGCRLGKRNPTTAFSFRVDGKAASMRIEYHPALETDLREVVDFYNSRSSGLGAEFLSDFEMLVLRIAFYPQLWRTVENEIRRALMPRFPYCVYFRIINEELIRITVVKHQRQHPGYGLER